MGPCPQIGLGLVILPPCVAGFTLILQHTSAAMVLYLWAFMLGLQLLALTVYPVLIAPLFNKFDPLPSGPLRHAPRAAPTDASVPDDSLLAGCGPERLPGSLPRLPVEHLGVAFASTVGVSGSCAACVCTRCAAGQAQQCWQRCPCN